LHQEELDKAAFERFGPHFHYVGQKVIQQQ
jgi:hypothetical protein